MADNRQPPRTLAEPEAAPDSALLPEAQKRPSRSTGLVSLRDLQKTMTLSEDAAAEFIEQDVLGVLRARGVPRKQLVPPKPEILTPGLEALRYLPMREALASLIASTMDSEHADSVLPAFVEVLKQLSADELALLQRAPEPGRQMPTAHLMFKLPSRELLVVYRHIMPPAWAEACAVKRNIPIYVDNLMRLSLLTRTQDQTADASAFRQLSKLDFVAKLTERPPPNAVPVLDSALIGITSFGEAFRRACAAPPTRVR